MVTSPATMWLHPTPSKQKSKLSSPQFLFPHSFKAVFSTEPNVFFMHYDDAYMTRLFLQANGNGFQISIQFYMLPKVTLPAPAALS